MRTFIAIDTPREVRQSLVDLVDRLRSSGADVRWEPPGKLHATLKFLGETDSVQLERVVIAIEAIAAKVTPFTVRYSALGCFPRRDDPRIVWVGVDDSGGALLSLQKGIERSLVSLGFNPDDRPFHPHITLGRVKTRRGVANLLRMLESITFHTEPVSVHGIELMRSELRPSGSVYTTLKSIPLTA